MHLRHGSLGSLVPAVSRLPVLAYLHRCHEVPPHQGELPGKETLGCMFLGPPDDDNHAKA